MIRRTLRIAVAYTMLAVVTALVAADRVLDGDHE